MIGCALLLIAQTAPESAPAPPDPTLGERFRTLRESRERNPELIAERAALHFLLAVAVGDGQHAVRVLDTVGYQSLPFGRDLPEDPPRPVRAEALAMWISALPESDIHRHSASVVKLLRAEAVRPAFPAVERWALSGDYFLVIERVPEARNWVRQRACLVVRVRGSTATVVGGNLLAALEETSRPDGVVP